MKAVPSCRSARTPAAWVGSSPDQETAIKRYLRAFALVAGLAALAGCEPMYQAVTGAGFTDVWAALRRRLPGLTCCHLSDLSNKRPTFDKRIDYVFASGLGDRVRGRVRRRGLLPFERLPGPEHKIWPSDHAGLVVRFVVPPGHTLAAAP